MTSKWPQNDLKRAFFTLNSALGPLILTFKKITLYFTGKHCETQIDPCASKPCEFGRCTIVNYSYSCECHHGFEGLNCDSRTDTCEVLLPCKNGGECLNLDPTEYKCECPKFQGVFKFSGKNCEIQIDLCDSGPCENGGKCYFTQESLSYSCECVENWTGTNCGTWINECEKSREMACSGNGECNFLVGESPRCDCKPGFIGLFCEAKIDYREAHA